MKIVLTSGHFWKWLFEEVDFFLMEIKLPHVGIAIQRVVIFSDNPPFFTGTQAINKSWSTPFCFGYRKPSLTWQAVLIFWVYLGRGYHVWSDFYFRRDGRVVECAGLLNRWRSNRSSTGSNPVLSATSKHWGSSNWAFLLGVVLTTTDKSLEFKR